MWLLKADELCIREKKIIQQKINHIWVKIGTTFSPASTIIPQLEVLYLYLSLILQ